MSLIIIRLHPKKPVSAAEFSSSLFDLTITIRDMSFADAEGDLIGETDYEPPLIGSAEFLPLPNPAHPENPDPITRITQTFVEVVPGVFETKAVATAVIEDATVHPEYAKRDILLEIKRGASGKIVHRQIYYNVPTSDDPLPNPAIFPTLTDVSLYLELPAADVQLDPGSDAFVELPPDGSPPNFDNLKAAVEKVLAVDPAVATNLATLTPKLCSHIAYEIVWNRQVHPIPTSTRSLEEMYTKPEADSDDAKRDRMQFEAELEGYYAQLNAEADRLAKFVYSLSAAIFCEEESTDADRVGFSFPIRPAAPDSAARIKETTVILTHQPTMTPSFNVLAKYFYALGAIMPPQVTAEQRYQMAILQDEERTVLQIRDAIDSGAVTEDAAMNKFQAARRLHSLGDTLGKIAEFSIAPATPVHALVQAWLNFAGENIADFWAGAMAAHASAHVDLVLFALTEGYVDPNDNVLLGEKIKTGLAVNSAEGLATKTVQDWEDFFLNSPGWPNNSYLPPFTAPGTADERLEAFIRHVKKFFEMSSAVNPPGPPVLNAIPMLDRASWDPIQAFITEYNAVAPVDFAFGSPWTQQHVQTALNNVFPDDPEARAWLEEVLHVLDDLYVLSDVPFQADLRFSIMEALYARGFTSKQSVKDMSFNDFQEALTGSIAYDHAAVIYANAGGAPGPAQPGPKGFKPINPDGLLTNCIPPPHLSPLGPVAYLKEILQVSEISTCDDPFPENPQKKLIDLLKLRRGSLGDLQVTRTNLETPLPLIDLVNECLEFITDNLPAQATGVIYNTAVEELGGHKLKALGSKDENDSNVVKHNPETLFEALPEHSSPATPTKKQAAYESLQSDFSSPQLPYSQPLNICRSYLRQLRTSRYAVMRRFREEITEFVLDPSLEPNEFQKHLWRYPVRIDIAREYLGLNPEEYDLLFTQEIVEVPSGNQLLLWEFYGFKSELVNGKSWKQIVVKLSEFLKRTGLAYCEFFELWKSEFVKFRPFSLRETEEKFPECEPCYLEKFIIEFLDPQDPGEALKRLAVFIRLWRKLQAVEGAKYSFSELRDICEVLLLFDANGDINPDFIRQLAAFQIFRDHFGLKLKDETDKQQGIGADRTHLLSIWVGNTANKWNWAIEHLLDRIQYYAQARHHCDCRPPEFIKLLAENLDPLSLLAGFDPLSDTDNWHSLPTHTLRFAEVLAKIYASDFGIGEMIFLFTAEDHLTGDDPYPLPPQNEALDSPLDLPDDEEKYSLWVLRQKLLDVEITDEDSAYWTWPRIEVSLRQEFDYVPAIVDDPLVSLFEHFFPSILEDSGHPVDVLKRQYRFDLATTSVLMWNTPPEGPYRYDFAAKKLWTQIPITDEAVLAKLSRIRNLTTDEQNAVQELYFKPRADLAQFSFIFANFPEAEERIIQEEDESKRWKYFQQEFARFHKRCKIMAQHLANHVNLITESDHGEGFGLAWRLLQHLFADENKAKTSWETDSGQVPEVTWKPQPNGGAFSALLGLTGTGLLGEYTPETVTVNWREIRGPMSSFGPEENKINSPIPTIIPSMALTITPDQEKFIGIRNGFGLANPDGAMIGGLEEFTVRWRGALLVENDGTYEFRAGAPTPEGEEPDFELARHRRWRVTLKRGQKTWIVLSHKWPEESAPPSCSEPVPLKRGAYQLTVEFVQPKPNFKEPDEVCPQLTGFQLKYSGPDSKNQIITIPLEKLYRDTKVQTLDEGTRTSGATKLFLELHYTSTLRDIRRTYQRAFKALLFAHRFDLSAKPESDDGQSEIGYMLVHFDDFAGTSYYRSGPAFNVHHANFDFNFLPLKDNYHPPTASKDQRVNPSSQRQQALFDWWERIFDYTAIRQETEPATERPLWLVFHEAAEIHPDDPAHLLRHMGVDLSHAELVLKYYQNLDVSSSDLEDERWTYRVWQAEKWIRILMRSFFVKNIRNARPDLWASDNPSVLLAGETVTGNENLTKFYRDGCIENGEPKRYEDIKRLNNGLRERARTALLAYLCGMDRVQLPWGGFATEPKHLSELLLLDVEVGICQKASRIEEAITAVQIFIQRARLGLELTFLFTPQFTLLWDRHFLTFHIWEACKRRTIYKENWIVWDEFEIAQRSEAFRFLESELRRTTLTVAAPGGLEYWPDLRPPIHPGLMLLQSREPAIIQQITPPPEGLGLLGTPERHARPSWLAPLHKQDRLPVPVPTDEPAILAVAPPRQPQPQAPSKSLPFWLQAAVRLGVRFIRVAAAGIPPASTKFEPKPPLHEGCCIQCGLPHPAVMDEYYFWIFDTRYYTEIEQIAEWGTDIGPQGDSIFGSFWHSEAELPKLLHWESKPMVHLAWCRVHNNEFQQPRRSFEGVRVDPNTEPQLIFLGRVADSLNFKVTGGIKPTGFPLTPDPGFRYDLATDTAVVLPLIVDPPPIDPDIFPGDLQAYPFFTYFVPGAPLLPLSLFNPAVSVASALRAHCRFEAALKWYELIFKPLEDENTWCPRDHREGPVGVVVLVEGEGEEGEQPVGTPGIMVPPPHEEPGGEEEPPEGERPPVREELECCQATDLPPEIAQKRAIVLYYLETLIRWGEVLMHQNSPEKFQQARLIFDTAAKILGQPPTTVHDDDLSLTPQTVKDFVASFAPLNPRLVSLYERIGDRLLLIHACLNGHRLRNGRPNLDMPYWGNSPLRDGWQTTVEACEDLCCSCGHYRFIYIVQKALELANEVRGLGGALLSAYEKGDSEYLAFLRLTHERQLLNLSLEIRQNQWREADWQVQALYKTKEIAETKRRYYNNLIQRGLISEEVAYENLNGVAIGFKSAAIVSEAISQAMGMIPDFTFGTAGIAGTPVAINQIPIGTKLAGVFQTAARIAGISADIASTQAGLSLTKAGWVRREEEWIHQVEVLDIEIEQIERQILAAERRRDISLRELNNHRRQMEQSAEVHDFLRDKFTNHTLYLWLQQETAALHYQMYEMALCLAHQAQKAFNYERGHTARKFLPAEIWDNLHEGLLAGERLQLSLRQMEKAYLCENAREYELTKHISLRLHFPLSYLCLLVTGFCEIEIPEWMFDLDYPGQYMRRIKNVTLTLPCVVGPYTGVHCRLTLLSSTTRVDPRLSNPQASCCPKKELHPLHCECVDVVTENDGKSLQDRYVTLPDDPRIVRQYAATEAIATSGGQNDSGMFELNFRDDRYLPFEFAGAISRWRIELPRENNQFDLDTLTDVIVHMNYTAREGGDVVARVANEVAQQNLPGAGLRLFDLEHELPEAWHFLQSCNGKKLPRQLGLRLGRNMFPYLRPCGELWINRLDLFFETSGAKPSAHHLVEFLVGHKIGHEHDEKCECGEIDIHCISTAEWPCLFHGTLSIDLGPLGKNGYENLGTFKFDDTIGTISRAFLICGYELVKPGTKEKSKHWKH